MVTCTLDLSRVTPMNRQQIEQLAYGEDLNPPIDVVRRGLPSGIAHAHAHADHEAGRAGEDAGIFQEFIEQPTGSAAQSS